jgi:hypothetical protein
MIAAFAIAPLWVPILLMPFARFVIFPYSEQSKLVVVSVFLSAIISYGGTIFVGLPALLFLRSHNLTSPWISIALGFAIGTIVLSLFMALFSIALGHNAQYAMHAAQSTFTDWRPNMIIWTGIAGLVGSLVGITLWLIARPDRH